MSDSLLPSCFWNRRQAIRALGGLALAPAMVAAQPAGAGPGRSAPLVIAHRGASGYLPEHTLAAYWMAIEQGADFIEPDLVATRDGVLVARHESALALLDADGSVREATTDVAERPEFASRRTTRHMEGRVLSGWFTEDFTLAELKTLRARERLPRLRPANTRFDDMFEVPTFDEVLDLVRLVNLRRQARGRGEAPVGVYPELKHPGHSARLGLPLEEALLRALSKAGEGMPVFIQSFEVACLRKLRGMTSRPLVQLLAASGRPPDFAASGDLRGYADLARPEGLAEVARYAQVVAVHVDLLIPTAGGRLGEATPLVRDAHRAGLLVHGWTFRAENSFLPDDYIEPGADPGELGDLAGYLTPFLDLGLDGFFTDHPALGCHARDARTTRLAVR